MNPPPPWLLPPVLAVAALVALGWWANQLSPPPDTGAVQRVEARAADHPTPTAPPTPQRAAPTLAATPDAVAADQLLTDIAEPALSNLPPGVFAETSALGAEVVTSYAAGHLEADFAITRPAGFPPQQAGCCPDVRIIAAGAYSDPIDDALVQVTVAWDGRRPGNRQLLSTVFITYDPATGQWAPAEDPDVDDR